MFFDKVSKGSSQKFFVVPETNMIRLGGRGCEPKSQVDRHCAYDMYMHAIFVVQHSKLCSFQREGRGSKYEMNDVRFRDDRKLLRRPLSCINCVRMWLCLWAYRQGSPFYGCAVC